MLKTTSPNKCRTIRPDTELQMNSIEYHLRSHFGAHSADLLCGNPSIDNEPIENRQMYSKAETDLQSFGPNWL